MNQHQFGADTLRSSEEVFLLTSGADNIVNFISFFDSFWKTRLLVFGYIRAYSINIEFGDVFIPHDISLLCTEFFSEKRFQRVEIEPTYSSSRQHVKMVKW